MGIGVDATVGPVPGPTFARLFSTLGVVFKTISPSYVTFFPGPITSRMIEMKIVSLSLGVFWKPVHKTGMGPTP